VSEHVVLLGQLEGRITAELEDRNNLTVKLRKLLADEEAIIKATTVQLEVYIFFLAGFVALI